MPQRNARRSQSFGRTRSEATTKPGQCLFCGAKLLADPMKQKIFGTDALGPYLDNSFCSLRCGYLFGLDHAMDIDDTWPFR